MSIHPFPALSQKDADAESLWQAYVEAAKRAQKSLRLDDGIKAGRAWAAFIQVFETVVGNGAH